MTWPAFCSLSMGQVIEKRNLHPKNIDMFGQPSLELQVISFHILAYQVFEFVPIWRLLFISEEEMNKGQTTILFFFACWPTVDWIISAWLDFIITSFSLFSHYFPLNYFPSRLNWFFDMVSEFWWTSGHEFKSHHSYLFVKN